MSDEELTVSSTVEWGDIVNVYGNVSSIQFGASDIFIVYASKFGNEPASGVRVIMTHDLFFRNMEMMLPYYDLIKQMYGDRQPRIPDENSEEYTKAVNYVTDKYSAKD